MRSAEQKLSLAGELFAAGLFLAYAVVLFAHLSPPSLTDYANWTYQGVLLRAHLLGMADPLHALKPYPVPNSMATLGIGVLALVVRWQIAMKLWLCIQFAISFFALRHMAQTLRVGIVFWVLTPSTIFLNINFWYGFVNFELGLAWIILFASILLRLRQQPAADNRSWDWMLTGTLLLAFFTHMIPFAFCCLLLLAYAAQTARWRLLWNMLPSALLTLWYVAGRFLVGGNADGQTGMQASAKYLSSDFFIFKANSVFKSLGFVNPSGAFWMTWGIRVFSVALAVNLIFLLLLLWALTNVAFRAATVRSQFAFLWVSIAAMVPVCILLPGALLGISDPGARLLQCLIALALVLLGAQRSVAVSGSAACAAILTVIAFVAFARFAMTPHFVPIPETRLPRRLLLLSEVPYTDQNSFYRALDRGDLSLSVFPTGLFVNPAGVTTPQ